VKFAGLAAPAASLILGLAFATGAQARESTITIRVKAVRGHVEFFHRGKRLTDPGLDQLCATARKQKADIDFQRDKMGSNDTMAALLREAQCLGSRNASAAEPAPKPKSSARTHATHRRTKGTPR
jgi:hypothetical protein